MTQSKYIDHSTHFAHIDDDIDLQLVEKTEAYARNASEHIAEAVARIGILAEIFENTRIMPPIVGLR